jgi:hypothetical protein
MLATLVFLSNLEKLLKQAINTAIENQLANNDTKIDEQMSAINSRLEITINAIKTLNSQFDNIEAMLQQVLNVLTLSMHGRLTTRMPVQCQEESTSV